MSENTVNHIKKVSSRLLVSLFLLIGGLSAIFFAFIYFDSGLTLPVVLMLGALGAFISLQRRLKSLSVNDLQLFEESLPYTWLAPIAGAVLAGVLYLLFLSGLLAGELFPEFKPIDPTGAFGGMLSTNSTNSADYAKLFFWSFVSGFSEKFVIDIIGKFEVTAKGSAGSVAS